MCDLVVAIKNVAAPGRRIVRGTVLCADDPVVARMPRVFQVHQIQHHCGDAPGGPVEVGTAAPGEVRNVKLPSGKKPPTSGPGSGIEAWRAFVGQNTDLSTAELADLSRDELIELAG